MKALLMILIFGAGSAFADVTYHCTHGTSVWFNMDLQKGGAIGVVNLAAHGTYNSIQDNGTITTFQGTLSSNDGFSEDSTLSVPDTILKGEATGTVYWDDEEYSCAN